MQHKLYFNSFFLSEPELAAIYLMCAIFVHLTNFAGLRNFCHDTIFVQLFMPKVQFGLLS